MIKMKAVLHPTDFSEPSRHAMGYAIALARECEAKLYLLHVIEEVSTAFYLDILVPQPAVRVMADIEGRARQALEEILPPDVRGTLPTEYLVRRGQPFVEILHCARQIEADIIVCGTHGRTGLKHLIMGSVAENVVRKSPCPVLSVRHPEHRFEMPS